MEKKETTYEIKIYLSGSIEAIKDACRQYCLAFGLCVTVKETLFIYTGGEEYGAEIDLLNYPRFPATNEVLFTTAYALAELCRAKAMQHSFLIVTPEKTIWNSIRKEQ